MNESQNQYVFSSNFVINEAFILSPYWFCVQKIRDIHIGPRYSLFIDIYFITQFFFTTE